MYKTAISNAKGAGETSKVRRYDRGLKVTGMWMYWHSRVFNGFFLRTVE